MAKRIFFSEKLLVYILSIAGFFAIFSTTISKNPVLPLFAQALGAQASVIGLIAAFSPFAGILFGFPMGLLSDRIGAKKLLLASAIIFAIAPLLYLLVNDPLLLVPIRFFHGIATAILGPVAASMIFKTFPKNKAEKAGLYDSATLIGRTIAPIAGGLVLTFFAGSQGLLKYQMVYLLAFAAALPVFFLVLSLPKDSGKNPVLRTLGFFSSLKKVLAEKKIVATSLVQMSAYFAFGAFETYLPLFMLSKGFNALDIGLVFSIQVVSIAISRPLFGKLSDKADRRWQIIAGILGIGACTASITLFSGFLELGLLSIIFGLALSFCISSTGAFVADLAKKREIGASVGLLSSVMDIGHSTGPLISGVIITASSFALGFVASLVLAVCTSCLFAAIAFRKA